MGGRTITGVVMNRTMCFVGAMLLVNSLCNGQELSSMAKQKETADVALGEYCRTHLEFCSSGALPPGEVIEDKLRRIYDDKIKALPEDLKIEILTGIYVYTDHIDGALSLCYTTIIQ